MGMLEGEAVRGPPVELGQPFGRKVGLEMRALPGDRGRHALAAAAVNGVAPEVMGADAGALVGVDDSAAPLQAPLADCTDRAVDPARPRRGGGDEAGIGRVEAPGHLQEQGDHLAETVHRARGIGQVLVAGNAPTHGGRPGVAGHGRAI